MLAHGGKLTTKRDVNTIYEEDYKQDVEAHDSCLYREAMWRWREFPEVYLNPDLNVENRVHIMRRAWYTIQSKMIGAGLVPFEVFVKSFDSDAFAIKDEWLWFTLRTANIESIWSAIKETNRPDIIDWFKRLALHRTDCPLEILKGKYTNL
jgi:hypothetical protein